MVKDENMSESNGRMRRREVIARGSFGACALALSGGAALAVSGRARAQSESEENQLDRKLVQEYVLKCHFNEARVRELVTAEPTLINAAWDWYMGDWETGLGAAAHTGRLPIAEFLLERGHRMDVYCAAMMGELGYVKAVIGSQPSLMNVLGPHGLPLTSHSRVGGDRAKEVHAFLLARGAVTDEPMEREALEAYAGVYKDAASGERITFVVRAGALQIQRADYGKKMFRMLAQGDHAFIAGDDQRERMDFALTNGKSIRVVIRDGGQERVLARVEG